MEILKPLVLAFVGDAVHTLYVREHFARQGDYTVNQLNRMVKEKVNAKKQCEVILKLEPILSDEEKDVARQARNSVKGQRAKNYSVFEYNHATAFEALVGYLYITKKSARLEEILRLSVEE